MKKIGVFILAAVLAALSAGCLSTLKDGGEKGSPTEESYIETPVCRELPVNLPDTLADASSLTCEGGYLLLGEVSETDIALYCDNLEERSKVYLRYGEHFQEFSQKVWTDTSVLPELAMEDWDGDGEKELSVKYLWHEGVYFDGESMSPGLVCEFVVYRWDGDKWRDIHFSSSGAMRTAESESF